MPLLFQRNEDGLRYAVWHVTETLPQLYALLPHAETYRAEAERRFKAENRRAEFAAVRVLLHKLSTYEYTIAYRASGKPFLENDQTTCISISHTKDYVAVALCADEQVGIDIEHTGERVRKVASRFLHADEQADTTEKMLLHWSAKEAVFKIIDLPAIDFREHLRVRPFRLSPDGGTFTVEEYRTGQQETFAVTYHLHKDFVLTVARGQANQTFKNRGKNIS